MYYSDYGTPWQNIRQCGCCCIPWYKTISEAKCPPFNVRNAAKSFSFLGKKKKEKGAWSTEKIRREYS